jgi:CheY-like chemotaxis protein
MTPAPVGTIGVASYVVCVLLAVLSTGGFVLLWRKRQSAARKRAKPAPIGVTAATDAPQPATRPVGVPTTVAVEPATIPPGLRVLVAEDGHFNQVLAKGLLAKLGCVVDVATNGREALALYQAAAYDAILMDCQMPEMDGFETTAAIRGLERGRGTPDARIPIIALTASSGADDREQCLHVGMDDFCAKPFTLADLGQVLARWTGTAAVRRSA